MVRNLEGNDLRVLLLLLFSSLMHSVAYSFIIKILLVS